MHTCRRDPTAHWPLTGQGWGLPAQHLPFWVRRGVSQAPTNLPSCLCGEAAAYWPVRQPAACTGARTAAGKGVLWLHYALLRKRVLSATSVTVAELVGIHLLKASCYFAGRLHRTRQPAGESPC